MTQGESKTKRDGEYWQRCEGVDNLKGPTEPPARKGETCAALAGRRVFTHSGEGLGGRLCTAWRGARAFLLIEVMKILSNK